MCQRIIIAYRLSSSPVYNGMDSLVDMASAEPERRRAAVDVDPLVVGVRHMERARVLVGVAVRVADERSLPLLCYL